MSTTYLRGCAHCAALTTTADPTSAHVYCPTCTTRQPTWQEWADTLAPGDHAYLQPGLAWHDMTRSEHVIVARSASAVTVQIPGLPASLRTVHITDLTRCDVTPRPTQGWMP